MNLPNSWEVRKVDITIFTAFTGEQGLHKEDFQYVVCNKDIPTFRVVVTSHNLGLVIFMPSNKWGPDFTSDKGFYGWGSTEEQAIQNALNIKENLYEH